MGTTRKAPSGPKHARCVHHEAYATAPAGWLCFADASAPTDDAILERMVWADDIEAIRAEHRRQWAERAEPDGMAVAPAAWAEDGSELTIVRETALTTRVLGSDGQTYTGTVRWGSKRVAIVGDGGPSLDVTRYRSVLDLGKAPHWDEPYEREAVAA